MAVIQTFDVGGKEVSVLTYKNEEADSSSQTGIRSPGSGDFQISPVEISVDKDAAGVNLKVSTSITGKNIAHIFADVLLFDSDNNRSYGPVSRKFLQADQEKEIGGVLYPKWEEQVELSFMVSPTVRLLSDGENYAFGFGVPKSYSPAGEKKMYSIKGLYQRAGSPDQQEAQMTFSKDGEMKKLMVSSGSGRIRTLRETNLKAGDQFTPFVEALRIPQENGGGWEKETAISNPLTFNDHPFTWETGNLFPGVYFAGIIVQDLDGQMTRAYSKVSVGE